MHHFRPPRHRHGTTFIEQLIILTLLGLLLAVSITTGTRLLDRAAVNAASRDAADAIATARDHATTAGLRTAVQISESEKRLVVHAGTDTVLRKPLGDTHGVTLESSRDSMAYAPSGIGWGASNLRLIIQRGAAADTLTVSRLGRVRR